jgi:hypothetical protein
MTQQSQSELGPDSTAVYDPFGKDVAQAQLIVQMKIYDVLMALLTLSDPAVAKDLDELHSKGVVIGQGPTFLQFFDRSTESLPDE